MTHAHGGELVPLLDRVLDSLPIFPFHATKPPAFWKKKKTGERQRTGFAEVRVDESLEWCSRTTYMGPVQ